MSNFSLAFDWILKAEGGYINDPKDPGGETKFGICKRSYPNLDVANLTQSTAFQIYQSDYWNPCKCNDMDSRLAICVFDCAVNQGIGTAIKLLQKALKISVDGIIGNQTLAAIENADIKVLITNFMSYRIQQYVKLVIQWQNYGSGWTNRCFNLIQYIYTEIKV